MTSNGVSAWINEYPQSLEVPTRDSATGRCIRRKHNKSRNGCQNCRKRRIKCDELKPECGQCLHRQVVCQFHANSSAKLSPSAFNNPKNDMAFRGLINKISLYLEEAGIPDSDKSKYTIRKREDVRKLLDHFVNTTIHWLGSPDYQNIMKNQGLSLAIDAPYLIHAILAISASHLSHLKQGEEYSVAAAIHYQHALTTYSSQLSVPIDSKNVDKIISCGFLQTMLAFESISRLSEDNKIYDTGAPISATWLRAMQGMGILQRTQDILPLCPKSIWLPVFLESGGCEVVRCEHEKEPDDSWASITSKALHSLCKVPLEGSSQNNIYHKPLKFLCQLMRLDPSHETIGRFIVFIGELPADFLQLFEENDIKTMLLMAYWCALVSGIDQWWIVDSAISECRRLCAILDSASEVRDLLLFPARRCGYVLGE